MYVAPDQTAHHAQADPDQTAHHAQADTELHWPHSIELFFSLDSSHGARTVNFSFFIYLCVDNVAPDQAAHYVQAYLELHLLHRAEGYFGYDMSFYMMESR